MRRFVAWALQATPLRLPRWGAYFAMMWCTFAVMFALFATWRGVLGNDVCFCLNHDLHD
jgi:hypothetical protein